MGRYDRDDHITIVANNIHKNVTKLHPPNVLMKDILTREIVPYVFAQVAMVAHCVINE
ncbi:hypothetical protein KIN20_001981 [Parelaphostrongylus tenuis]|uniref:Uncharacterized protein n=1 Tax=Parelaphostrongylus tenuis TaxID=148309 RepID=A0AAD5MMX4_PARTN|nr:hypothetical protein KIN20_001981 [Parelaphostrongylus tenuis]